MTIVYTRPNWATGKAEHIYKCARCGAERGCTLTAKPRGICQDCYAVLTPAERQLWVTS